MPSPLRIPLLAAALLLAACDSAPTDPARRAGPALSVEGEPVSRAVEEHLIDYDGGDVSTQFECPDGTTSEPIDLFGKVYEKTTMLVDGTGAIHISTQVMPVGFHGIGRESGTIYRIAERTAAAYLQRTVDNEGTFQGAFRTAFALVAEQGGPRYEYVSHGHYRIGDDGEPVVEWGRTTIECRA